MHITESELKALEPCNDGYRRGLKAFSKGHATVASAKANGVPLADTLWVLRRLSLRDESIRLKLIIWSIECVKRVYHEPSWNAWADDFISGKDRSPEAARAAADAADAAAAADAYVVAYAAHAAAYAARAAAYATAHADAAAYAAAYAADAAAADAYVVAYAAEREWQYERLCHHFHG